jgi:hypothetical protein
VSARRQSYPADAERRIAQTRAELALTLDALRHRLTARHFVEKGFAMFKDNVADYEELTQQGLDIIRANPIPVALIGIGAAWLIAANTISDERAAQARQKIAGIAGDLGARASELASGIAGRVGLGGGSGNAPDQALGHTGNPMVDEAGRARPDGWLHQVADMTQGALRSARDSGGAMLNRAGTVAGDGASRVTDQLSDMFVRNPLMVGAIGVMTGAVLAAVLPMTSAESRLLGDEELQRKAGEAGELAVARVREAAAETLEAAADVVRGEADKPSHA